MRPLCGAQFKKWSNKLLKEMRLLDGQHISSDDCVALKVDLNVKSFLKQFPLKSLAEPQDQPEQNWAAPRKVNLSQTQMTSKRIISYYRGFTAGELRACISPVSHNLLWTWVWMGSEGSHSWVCIVLEIKLMIRGLDGMFDLTWALCWCLLQNPRVPLRAYLNLKWFWWKPVLNHTSLIFFVLSLPSRLNWVLEGQIQTLIGLQGLTARLAVWLRTCREHWCLWKVWGSARLHRTPTLAPPCRRLMAIRWNICEV